MLRIPFDPAELTPRGAFPSLRPGVDGFPILSSPITPRENFRAFLAGKKPLWMPSFGEVRMFLPSLFVENRARGFVNEDTPYSGPIGGPDWFGVSWEWDPVSHGSMVRPGNPLVPDITQWEKYVTFPDLDALDWEASARANPAHRTSEQVVQMPIFSGLFERLISMVDMTNALIAMVDEEEQPFVHALFDRLCFFYDDLFAHIARWYQVDYLHFHDDWGTQRAPFFSPNTCREMLLPYLRRVVDSAHKYGFGFELHCCGKNEPLVPIMIEAGVDMWGGQPINDKAMLYREYGRDIKLGVEMPPPTWTTPQERETAVSRFLDRFPENCYWNRSPQDDPLCYPLLYAQSRRLYHS